MDLLGARAQCMLKCDKAGQLHIFRDVVTSLGETDRPAGIPPGAEAAPGLHQTLVTRSGASSGSHKRTEVYFL